MRLGSTTCGDGWLANCTRTWSTARDLVGRIQELLGEQIEISGSFERAFEVSLLSILLSQAKAVLALERAEKLHESKIVLRAAFEHLVELKMLLNTPERHHHLRLEFEKSMLHILEAADRGNPYYQKIKEHVPTAVERNATQMRIDQTKDLGGSKQVREQDWHKAGMSAEYQAIYRSLSSIAHPSYSGAINRNLTVSDEEPPVFHVKVDYKAPPETTDVIVDALNWILEEVLVICGDVLPD